MKEGKNEAGRKILKTILFSLILIIPLAIAAHTITPTSYSVNEDVGQIYNITVNNTDTLSGANITEVNITIPSTFTLIANSNGTNAGTHTFTNTTTVLSWNNDGLVMNLTTKYFWFNATASTPGTYNFTVETTNVTGTESTNISVTINDTTVPEILEGNITNPLSNSSQSGTIILNVTIIDNGVMDTVFFNVTNSSGVQNATYTASNPTGNYWNASLNTNDFPEGTYNITVYANDTYGNANNTAHVYNVTFDNTVPVATHSCTPTSVYTGATITCTCTGTDALSGVASTSHTASPSTTTAGTFTTSCTVTDNAGNIDIESVSYTVSNIDKGYPSFSTGGSALKTGYEKTMEENWEISFQVGSSTHILKIKEITKNSARITISSTTQEATFLIGEEKKFDVSGDNYYDTWIKLNSIDYSNPNSPKADFIIKSIHEKMTEAEIIAEKESNGEITKKSPETTSEEGYNYTWITVLVIIIIAIVLLLINYKKQKKSSKK